MKRPYKDEPNVVSYTSEELRALRKKKQPRMVLVTEEEEEAAINRGIAEDPDNPELTEEDFRRMRPAAEVVPEIVEAYRKERRGRGPQKEPTKIRTTVRLSPDVVAYFKSKGRGWQTRLDEILKKHIKEHPQE